MRNRLIKNLSFTFIANIISLLVSMIGTLFIPKIIGVEQYGYWQLYIFYISYAGILHLGLCDGIYLSYGGRKYASLDFGSLRTQYLFLIISCFISCSLIGFGTHLIIKDHNVSRVIILTCLGAFIHVAKTYIMMIFQATNRLAEYSAITIIDRIIFAAGIIVIMFFSLFSYESIIICDIVGRIISLLIAMLCASKLILGKYRFDKAVCNEFLYNIRAGSKLLIAGIASNFIIGFIRIGIQNRWSIKEFGKISLALSLINMVLSFINMVAIVFFPILKNMGDEAQIALYKNANILLKYVTHMILIFAGLGGKIISIWLPQYRESAFYMILLLPVCICESETAMLLSTYLKAFRVEKAMMTVNLLTMIFSACLSFITTTVFGNIYLAIFAIDALILFRTIMLRRILNIQINNDGQEWLTYMSIFLLAIYLILYMFLDMSLAGVLYLVAYLICVFINRDTLKMAFFYFRNIKKTI